MSMRVSAIVALAAVAGLVACQKKDEAAKAPAGSEAAQAPTGGGTKLLAPPSRKPGLWAQSVSMTGMTQTSQICLDADTEKKMTLWGQQAGEDMCEQSDITRTPGGWSFVSRCDMGSGGKVVSTGVATGDFNAKYQVKVKSVTTGAEAPQMNGEHDMLMQAEWKGACPAGMKPGDITLPGGMKINILQMPAKPPRRARGRTQRRADRRHAQADGRRDEGPLGRVRRRLRPLDAL